MARVIRALPREVAQAVVVPTTLVLRSLVRDVGKELPRVELVICMFFGASKSKARQETFPACIPGMPQGTTIVPACSPQYSPLFASRACDTVERGLM